MSRTSAAGGLLLPACLVLITLVSGARAGVALSDPFLERFRVGHFAKPEAVELEGGWPASLFTPLRVDSLWAAVASAYFTPPHLGQGHGLLTWRFLAPAMGSAAELARWYAARQADISCFLAVSSDSLQLSVPDETDYLLDDALQVAAFNCYSQGRYDSAVSLVNRLLEAAGRLQLSPEEAFVWSLRKRRLVALAGDDVAGSEQEAIWPEMFALGPFDAQSAWSLWVARCRGRGWPLLPPGCGTDRLAQWLGGLQHCWLSAADLKIAGFADEALAGLGAAVLQRGADLDSHFREHDAPPQNGIFQGLWVHGRRRAAGYAAETTESLAALDGLAPAKKLDLWRRASEARLLGGNWTAGLEDLEQALRLLGTTGSAILESRLGDWTLQALVLARARQKDRAAERILELALGHLTGQGRKRFREEAGALGLLEEETPATSDLWLEMAKRRIRAGRAEPVKLESTADLAARCHHRREQLWEAWLIWGIAVVAEDEGAAARTARFRAYQSGLRSALRADSRNARFALACAAVGRFLRQSPVREQIVRWLLACDLAQRSAGHLHHGPSPLPRLAKRIAGKDLASRLGLHALLGIALATGDSRGQLAATQRLPQGPLTLDQRLRFMYPVPGPGPLLDGLVKAPLEASLMLAVARNESLFEPEARSRAGALGWLQIMPQHYAGRGFANGRSQWRDATISLATGARLLVGDAGRFAGDPYRTTAAYNAGGGAVNRWTRQLGGLTDRALFLAWIGYPETRRYVEKVLIDREIYDWILAGSAGSDP